jgi:hypothetical protein
VSLDPEVGGIKFHKFLPFIKTAVKKETNIAYSSVSSNIT